MISILYSDTDVTFLELLNFYFMKTKAELEQNIIDIIMTIHSSFPELSKYLAEMPDNDPDETDLDRKSLEEYYNSLLQIVTEYSKTHFPVQNELEFTD